MYIAASDDLEDLVTIVEAREDLETWQQNYDEMDEEEVFIPTTVVEVESKDDRESHKVGHSLGWEF